MDQTFHPAEADEANGQDEQEEERRRAERSQLNTTGRMPWRTFKLGTLVIIGAWTVSLVGVLAWPSYGMVHEP